MQLYDQRLENSENFSCNHFIILKYPVLPQIIRCIGPEVI